MWFNHGTNIHYNLPSPFVLTLKGPALCLCAIMISYLKHVNFTLRAYNHLSLLGLQIALSFWNCPKLTNESSFLFFLPFHLYCPCKSQGFFSDTNLSAQTSPLTFTLQSQSRHCSHGQWLMTPNELIVMKVISSKANSLIFQKSRFEHDISLYSIAFYFIYKKLGDRFNV